MSTENTTFSEREIGILTNVGITHENNRNLKANVPGILDTAIPLSDDELDSFLETFAETTWGDTMRRNIEAGSPCEARHDPEKPDARCGKPSVGSVDFYASSFSDAVLVCRDDVRFVYASIMSEDMNQDALIPVLTINGKAIPQIPQQEKVA